MGKYWSSSNIEQLDKKGIKLEDFSNYKQVDVINTDIMIMRFLIVFLLFTIAPIYYVLNSAWYMQVVYFSFIAIGVYQVFDEMKQAYHMKINEKGLELYSFKGLKKRTVFIPKSQISVFEIVEKKGKNHVVFSDDLEVEFNAMTYKLHLLRHVVLDALDMLPEEVQESIEPKELLDQEPVS